MKTIWSRGTYVNSEVKYWGIKTAIWEEDSEICGFREDLLSSYDMEVVILFQKSFMIKWSLFFMR